MSERRRAWGERNVFDGKRSWAADCSKLISHAGAHQQKSLCLCLSHKPLWSSSQALTHTTPAPVMKANPLLLNSANVNHHLSLMSDFSYVHWQASGIKLWITTLTLCFFHLPPLSCPQRNISSFSSWMSLITFSGSLSFSSSAFCREKHSSFAPSAQTTRLTGLKGR